LLADLRPGDHALAVWLLEQEIAALATADAGDPEVLYRLIAVVARFAHPEDALLIWRASQTNAETRIGVDVEQALRAGPEAVVRTMRRTVAQGGSEAGAAAAPPDGSQAQRRVTTPALRHDSTQTRHTHPHGESRSICQAPLASKR
jgi:hypothetical protein